VLVESAEGTTGVGKVATVEFGAGEIDKGQYT
jgi:hypothetical protein